MLRFRAGTMNNIYLTLETSSTHIPTCKQAVPVPALAGVSATAAAEVSLSSTWPWQ